MKNDVVSLPLARRARRVHQRRVLAIDSRCLSIGVGLALVGVQDLRLIKPLQEDAAVAAILVLSFRRRRLGKLDVQLAIAEWFARVDLARLWHHFKVAVLDFPFGRAAFFVGPLGKVFAIEKHHGVRWRASRRILRARRGRIDLRRRRPVGIVNLPLGIDLSATEWGDARQHERTNAKQRYSSHRPNLVVEALGFYREWRKRGIR